MAEKDSNRGSVTSFTSSLMSGMVKFCMPLSSCSARKSSKAAAAVIGFSMGFIFIDRSSNKSVLEDGGGGAEAKRSDVRGSDAGAPVVNPMPMSDTLPPVLPSMVEEIKSAENVLVEGAEGAIKSLPKSSSSILKGSERAEVLSTLVSVADGNPVDVKLENKSCPELVTWAMISPTKPTAVAWVLSATLPTLEETPEAGGGPPNS